MEPTIRLLLERCAEAIFDAGLHPNDLKNTRTGVFVGSCIREFAATLSRKPKPEKCFFFEGYDEKFRLTLLNIFGIILV